MPSRFSLAGPRTIHQCSHQAKQKSFICISTIFRLFIFFLPGPKESRSAQKSGTGRRKNNFAFSERTESKAYEKQGGERRKRKHKSIFHQVETEKSHSSCQTPWKRNISGPGLLRVIEILQAHEKKPLFFFLLFSLAITFSPQWCYFRSLFKGIGSVHRTLIVTAKSCYIRSWNTSSNRWENPHAYKRADMITSFGDLEKCENWITRLRKTPESSLLLILEELEEAHLAHTVTDSSTCEAGFLAFYFTIKSGEPSFPHPMFEATCVSARGKCMRKFMLGISFLSLPKENTDSCFQLYIAKAIQQVARAVLFRFSHSTWSKVAPRLCMRARDSIDKSECDEKFMISETQLLCMEHRII